jgi:lipoprotein-anchoring transpeptidase ErfK/SrfK
LAGAAPARAAASVTDEQEGAESAAPLPEASTPNLAEPEEDYGSVYNPAAAPQPLTNDPLASSDSSPGPSRDDSVFQVPAESPAAPAEPQGEPSAPVAAGTTFDSAWSSAMAQLEKGQWSEALLTLSLFYDDPALTIEQRTRLVDLLDPLAGKVIYSREHTMEPAHTVQPGETLQAIAQRVRVPAKLLQNINGIASPDNLAPGTQLKLIRGPFRAEVDLSKSELTLFLGKYYAGRFPISVGNDPPPQPGEFSVTDKQPGQEYFAPDNSRIAPLAAENPYGQWWLGLDGGFALHGTPPSIPTHGGLGCVSLSTADAADVYGILSVGSKVTLR